MSDFYGEMQDVAAGLLGEFAQGTIVLQRSADTTDQGGPGTGDDRPWDVTADPSPVDHVLQGVARPVEQKWVDGTRVTGREVQVTFAVPDVEPLLTDIIVVDGRPRSIVDLKRIPEAGTPVAYVAILRD